MRHAENARPLAGLTSRTRNGSSNQLIPMFTCRPRPSAYPRAQQTTQAERHPGSRNGEKRQGWLRPAGPRPGKGTAGVADRAVAALREDSGPLPDGEHGSRKSWRYASQEAKIVSVRPMTGPLRSQSFEIQTKHWSLHVTLRTCTVKAFRLLI